MQKLFKDIIFKESSHTYHINDWKFPISSTGWVHQFCQPFDAELHAGNIAKKRSKELMRDVTVQEILDERKEKGREATDEIGTPFHECMEFMLTKNNPLWYKQNMYSQNKINPKLYKIIQRSEMFYKEYIEHKKLIPIQSELILGSEKYLVAGQIDQIMQTQDQYERSAKTVGDDTQIIYVDLRDWKSSKKIEKNGYNKFMKQEFAKYPDANYYHYSLQLSLYKYILEYETKQKAKGNKKGSKRNTPIYIVENMYIGHFSYLKDEYTVIPVVDMTKEIEEHFSKDRELF